jgi:hypothetical protein
LCFTPALILTFSPEEKEQLLRVSVLSRPSGKSRRAKIDRPANKKTAGTIFSFRLLTLNFQPSTLNFPFTSPCG